MNFFAHCRCEIRGCVDIGDGRCGDLDLVVLPVPLRLVGYFHLWPLGTGKAEEFGPLVVIRPFLRFVRLDSSRAQIRRILGHVDVFSFVIGGSLVNLGETVRKGDMEVGCAIKNLLKHHFQIGPQKNFREFHIQSTQ